MELMDRFYDFLEQVAKDLFVLDSVDFLNELKDFQSLAVLHEKVGDFSLVS